MKLAQSEPLPPWSATEGLVEMENFFLGKSQAHQSLRRLAKRLEKAGIPYAVVGGMALNAHRYYRATKDVDVLLTKEGFEEFQRRFVSKAYRLHEHRPRRLNDVKNDVTLDVMVTGRFPGSGEPGPIAFPAPERVAERIEGILYVNLSTLVELKLAARRWKDFADVVELIRANNLDESFQEQLHASVRHEYIECLEEKRREDEYQDRG